MRYDATPAFATNTHWNSTFIDMAVDGVIRSFPLFPQLQKYVLFASPILNPPGVADAEPFPIKFLVVVPGIQLHPRMVASIAVSIDRPVST